LATILLIQACALAQSTTSIPAGSLLEVSLTKALDAKKSKVGDEVVLKVLRDMKDGDKVVISKNSKISGHLTDVKAKSKDQPQSVITITLDRAQLKEGGEIPIVVTIQALAKPADDRSGDMSDLMRGTSSNQTVSGMADNATGAGGHVGSASTVLTLQSQGVLGYTGIGLQDSTVYSPMQNVHLDTGTQMVLRISGK
jgi:predicted DNA-binding antitoxin AbrB/MazE fold protein